MITVETQVPEQSRQPRRSVWRLIAYLACLPLVAGLAYYFWVILSPEPYYNMDSQEVFASHLLALQVKQNLLNIQSSDAHAVQSWFAGRLDFTPPVCDLAADGFPLLGGRLDYMHNRPVAALVYLHDGHIINLFVWPGQTKEHGFERDGLYLEPWDNGTFEFWAIADTSEQTLNQFVTLFKSNAP